MVFQNWKGSFGRALFMGCRVNALYDNSTYYFECKQLEIMKWDFAGMVLTTAICNQVSSQFLC
ncbi:hypothetical protein THIOSC15_3620016 [uncultured Thiomicrorhabdus sp.]